MSKIDVPTVKLPGKKNFPIVGLGTWQGDFKADTDVIAASIELAVDMGYRHFDTAQMYFSEAGLGKGLNAAIKKGKITRDDIFVTTKLFPSHHLRKDVVRHLRKSLEELGLDYVDQFLIHWPCAYKTGESNTIPKDDNGKSLYADIDYLETWQGMEEAVDQGLTSYIGLSNFNKRQLERVLSNCRIKPVSNQFEGRLFFQNQRLIDFCQSKGLVVAVYRTLYDVNPNDDSREFNLDVVKEIAARHSKTIQQVALKYQVQRGIIVIPKSSKLERLRQNLELFDFELSEQELTALKQLCTNTRSLHMFKDAKEYPFSDPY